MRSAPPARSISTPEPAPAPVRLTPAIERDAGRLEAALRELTRIYERIGACAERRRAAVRTANCRLLQESLAEEAGAAGLAARADRDRADAVRSLAPALGLTLSPDLTASRLAQSLPEPWRGRLESAAGALRTTLERTREDHKADRLAAETIAAHLQGVLQAAAAAASGTVTYGARGAMTTRREQVASVMDLTT
jgi:hypothetical protein